MDENFQYGGQDLSNSERIAPARTYDFSRRWAEHKIERSRFRFLVPWADSNDYQFSRDATKFGAKADGSTVPALTGCSFADDTDGLDRAISQMVLTNPPLSKSSSKNG